LAVKEKLPFIDKFKLYSLLIKWQKLNFPYFDLRLLITPFGFGIVKLFLQWFAIYICHLGEIWL